MSAPAENAFSPSPGNDDTFHLRVRFIELKRDERLSNISRFRAIMKLGSV